MTETPAKARPRAPPLRAKPPTAAKPPRKATARTAKPAGKQPPEPPHAAGTGAAAGPLELLSPAQRETMEKLSLNLARAAMTAQGAIAEAALRQADRPSGLTPDPF